jgi:hypothetical protein
VNINDLVPVSALASCHGVKGIFYGPAGNGKTPIILTTAPRPVCCITEPGMLSVRNVHTVPAWPASTFARFKEFVDWVCGSHEARNFDTVVLDSASEAAEIKLREEAPKHKHGQKVYGAMAEEMAVQFNRLFHLPEKHVALICKETRNQQNQASFYFPGQALNVAVPHLYDLIARFERMPDPQNPGKTVIVIRTQGSLDAHCRDRGGKLAELEPAHLTYLFQKAMS